MVSADEEEVPEEIQKLTLCARGLIIMTLFGRKITTDEDGEVSFLFYHLTYIEPADTRIKTDITHDSKPHDGQHDMRAASENNKKHDAATQASIIDNSI